MNAIGGGLSLLTFALADMTRMGSVTPDPKKRGYLLPPGCKDLIDVLQGPPPQPSLTQAVSQMRVNGQIRAREVRVIGERGERLGVMGLADAIRLAQSRNADLVEIAPQARPPVCRIVDYGKFRYELLRRRKSKS